MSGPTESVEPADVRAFYAAIDAVETFGALGIGARFTLLGEGPTTYVKVRADQARSDRRGARSRLRVIGRARAVARAEVPCRL